MNTETATMFAAFGAAGLTGLFTTIVAVYAANSNRKVILESLKQNHRTTLEATRLQIVGPMKETWKNKIRELMAKLLSSLHGDSEMSKTDRNILLYQLELMLDDKREVLCSEIRRAIRIFETPNRNQEMEQELVESVNNCTRICFEITDGTWKEIQGKTASGT